MAFFFFVIPVSSHLLQNGCLLIDTQPATGLDKKFATPPLTTPHPKPLSPGAPSFGLEILVDFCKWPFRPLVFFSSCLLNRPYAWPQQKQNLRLILPPPSLSNTSLCGPWFAIALQDLWLTDFLLVCVFPKVPWGLLLRVAYSHKNPRGRSSHTLVIGRLER